MSTTDRSDAGPQTGRRTPEALEQQRRLPLPHLSLPRPGHPPLAEDYSLDAELKQRIRNAIREHVSPRHVPDDIVEAPAVPLPRTVLREVENRVLWLSTAIIHHANLVRPNPTGLKVGGHQASSASMTSIMTALWFRHLRTEDRGWVRAVASRIASRLALDGPRSRDAALAGCWLSTADHVDDHKRQAFVEEQPFILELLQQLPDMQRLVMA